MKEQFYKDLEEVYSLLKDRYQGLNKYFDAVDDMSQNRAERELIDNFLDDIGIAKSKESRFAVAQRIVSLKEDGFIQILKKNSKNEQEIVTIQEKSFDLVSKIYTKFHKEFVYILIKDRLLTPFYREILSGVAKVGEKITVLHKAWSKTVINDINKVLENRFNGDSEKIVTYLREKQLLDYDKDGLEIDRSYCVLVKKESENALVCVTYGDFFKAEISEVTSELNDLIVGLSLLEDEVFNQKKEWIEYFEAFKNALNEIDKTEVVSKWQDVDRKWMEITTPIQVGHPLEYYEDHYRKCVAFEWDLRIINPKLQQKNKIGESLKTLFDVICCNKPKNDSEKQAKEQILKNIDETQLYIGKPALFYGALFNGLFSAQVVPNDEEITKEKGKKIFAFVDFVLDSQRNKPFLKLDRNIFGDDFLQESREILFKKETIWRKIYEIETIGHEYGHILWLDKDSEYLMNKSGNFKNLEEFKATCGAFVAYFNSSSSELLKELTIFNIQRAVRLMSWRENGEVRPYYVEGLIHLTGLFESGVLYFDGDSLTIDLNQSNLEFLRMWYIGIYRKVVACYMEKRDAKEFLDEVVFCDKYFKANDDCVNDFVEFYWNEFKQIGQLLDDVDNVTNWLN